MFKSQSPKKKKSAQYRDHIYLLHPFIGVGDIENEKTSLKEIISLLGKAEIDETDERENRILEYPELGLAFKFLKIFNMDRKNPIVSFITIRKPFTDKSSLGIYPGLAKKEVYEKLKDYSAYSIKEREDTWIDKTDKKMKCSYDIEDKLESIIIF